MSGRMRGVPKGCDELGDGGPVSVAPHPVRKPDIAGTVDHEVTAQLEHVWSEAEESLAGKEEPQVTPIQRRREHRSEEIRAAEAPPRVGGSGTVQSEREGKLQIVEHLRFQKARFIIGDEENARRDRRDFTPSLQHLDQVRPCKRSGSVAQERDENGRPAELLEGHAAAAG